RCSGLGEGRMVASLAMGRAPPGWHRVPAAHPPGAPQRAAKAGPAAVASDPVRVPGRARRSRLRQGMSSFRRRRRAVAAAAAPIERRGGPGSRPLSEEETIMSRALWRSLLLLTLAAPAARAHFVWLLPGREGGKPVVRMVFSDTPAPDRPGLLKGIAGSEVFAWGEDGKPAALKFNQEKDAFVVRPTGPAAQVVAAVCRYGVVQRGGGEPFLLHYYARTWAGAPPPAPPQLLAPPSARLT